MIQLRIPKMPNIFRNKSMELGMELGMERGKQRVKAIALRATEEKRDDETIKQAFERIMAEEWP